MVEALNEQYKARDPWFDTVAGDVAGRPAVSSREVLLDGLGMEIKTVNSGHARRIADILRQLGWQQSPHPLSHTNGKRERVWRLPKPDSD